MKQANAAATIGVIAIALVGGARSALAQPPTGQLQQLLRHSLEELAQGQCSPSTLEPMMLGLCQQQQPGEGAQLAALGSIAQINFLGNQATPMGMVEVYKVDFSQSSMLWQIQVGADGKISAMAGAPPVPRQAGSQ